MKPGRGAPHEGAAGGPARHVPVLLEEVLDGLDVRADGLYLDATFGAGGYARALLDRGARVLASDRDPDAIAAGAELAYAHPGRLTLVHARFSEIEERAEGMGLGRGAYDGVVLDLGVSSMQLDEGARGFSFRLEGPLDMRMSRQGPSAADLVNEASEQELADILFRFGEERASRRIARAIVAERARSPILTTGRLAETVARANPARHMEIHPATRTFQGLRIAVNEELAEIEAALASAERLLKPGGRLCVVAFHSLEDRIAKQFLASRSGRGGARSRLLPGESAPPEPTFRLLARQPIGADEEEVRRNPRARSARLRTGERTQAPARAERTAPAQEGASDRPSTRKR